MRIIINSSFLISVLCSITILETITSMKSSSYKPSLKEVFENEIKKDQDFKKSLNSYNNNDFERHLLVLSQTQINKTNTTSPTPVKSGNSTTASSKTSKTKEANKTIAAVNKTQLAKSTQTNSSTTASSPDGDKKLKEMQDQQKKMESNVMAIEKEVKKVGGKIDKQINTSLEINKTVTKALGITRNLSRKMDMNQLKTEIKLNIINKHVMEQLRNQLFLQSVRVQHDIVNQQKKIQMLNLKITEIKSKLPNSNAICGKLRHCGSCTANPKCGWCSLTQTCVEGNEKGPLDGSCVFYDYQVCSSPRDCDTYKKCSVN